MPRKKPVELNYRADASQVRKVVSKPVILKLPSAHKRQYDLITALDRNPRLRFIVGACGTKFGKTYGCTIALVKHAWNNPGSLNWWVAPTFAQSKMAYILVKRLLPKDTYEEYKADMKIVLKKPDGSDHSTIEFKSGDNPDSLRGFGVHFFIIDEAARVPYESAVSVMTTVTQTMGKGLIISTPNGRGWFYDWYQRGEKFFRDGSPKYDKPEDDPWYEWLSIRMPSWSNPTVKREAIEQMRKNLPADVFQQEVAAEFLTDSAGVFRGIDQCVRGVFQHPQPGHRYVMGVDLARLRDYSVITVMDQATRHVVFFDRFNKVEWSEQYRRIVEIARRYRAVACLDSTGIGDPIVHQIQLAGIQVEPYKIGGSEAKKKLIDKLRVNIEQQRISFPHIPVLRRELENFEYQISDSGVVKYSAPSGQHDDCTISLALCNWLVDTKPVTYTYRKVRGI